MAADQILDAGLLGPAVGFVGLEFEFGDGFYWITWRQDFGVVGVELMSGGRRAGESPIALFVKAGGDGFDRAGQEIVVIGDGEGETGFDCIELS